MAGAGTEEDFTDFVHRNYQVLMAFGLAIGGTRAEAEDLVQSALTSAYPRWDRVRPEQAVAYLRRAMVNAQVSGWRRNRGMELTSDDGLDVGVEDRRLVRIDDHLVLAPLLRLLPARQRAALVLRYLCDLSDDEIAGVLEVRVATVRSLISRGLARLRTEQSAATAWPSSPLGARLDRHVEGKIEEGTTRP